MQDQLILHELYIERYEKNVSKEYKKILKELYKKVINDLISLENIDTIRGRRLIKFIGSLQPYFDEFGIEISDFQKKTIDEFVDFEARTEPQLAKEALSNVDLVGFTLEKLSAATALHMGTGQTIDELFGKSKDAVIDRIKKECSIGFLQGETTQQIISRVRATEDLSGRAAAAIVRTSLTHVSSQARNLVAKENSDVIKKIKWSSVLDLRTSDICRYRDGKFWDIDENYPVPPAHVNCRSSLAYVTGTEIIGAKRASMDGPVSSKTTYYEFLKRQPKQIIVDILGKERAELFYTGKLTGDQLHARDGALLTMKELHKKYDL